MMPAMPPDAHKIALKIIEAIKQHPVLYISDVKGSAIKLQEFRQKVWKRISDELGLEPGWVRLRWKNLRDTYCRILKHKNNSEKGVRRKKWIFEDHLSFLKFPYEADYQPQCVELSDEYIKEINSGGISTEDLLDQLENHNDEDYSEYLEVLEETSSDPILQPAISAPSPSPPLAPVTQSQENSTSSPNIDVYVQQIQSKYRKIQPKRPRMEPEFSDDLDESSDYGILSPHFKIEHLKLPSTGKVVAAKSAASTSRSFTVVSAASERSTRLISPASTPPPPSSPSPPPPQPPPPARQLSPPSSNVEDIPQPENFLAPVEKTSVELFFSSMARTVKALPLKAQAEIKMAVCRIVTEAEVQHSKRNLNMENTQQFIAPPGMIPKLVLIPCSMIDKPKKK